MTAVFRRRPSSKRFHHDLLAAVELTPEENQLLVAGLGALGGTGARVVAKRLRADIYETTVELAGPLPEATERVAAVLEGLGNRFAPLQAMVGAGAMGMNPAVITVTLNPTGDDAVTATVRGVAKEGLIKQHAGRKAAQLVAEALAGR